MLSSLFVEESGWWAFSFAQNSLSRKNVLKRRDSNEDYTERRRSKRVWQCGFRSGDCKIHQRGSGKKCLRRYRWRRSKGFTFCCGQGCWGFYLYIWGWSRENGIPPHSISYSGTGSKASVSRSKDCNRSCHCRRLLLWLRQRKGLHTGRTGSTGSWNEEDCEGRYSYWKIWAAQSRSNQIYGRKRRTLQGRADSGFAWGCSYFLL